ncbi:VOC family protein [Kaistia dalseonensis]|uniref:Catechol 2,3-dioxygenase-like lactoylglutathione lyase family enzyme n=1 Tax=Kaistia dalseonensis TaxID=410840 RepID=A0ABU0HB61_9HYPH|nr:VOC family protein [Kaistia dalseonensis]MCX5496924.1 VOC family protein [Kaistia dalseonensis]MDQ0439549.1 catechol 2,3-dioxygenase-like lactoylglutathione lyase family enzyme [Kaistia dalseonensis]
MPFDHLGFNVSNFLKSRDFYISALAPLDISIVHEGDGWAAFGEEGRIMFWIGTMGAVPGPIHFAFTARDHAAVRAFHAAAIEAGGSDNGAPGFRPNYHANYYAAFVLDPDGHNVEAVCHRSGEVA